MLSRSSWRAARVLRAARGLESGTAFPAAPAWSTNANTKKYTGECTCSASKQRRSFSYSRRTTARDEQTQVPSATRKNVDIKGKGREEEQYAAVSATASDHLATAQNEGSSYSAVASRRPQDIGSEGSTSANHLPINQLSADETELALLRSLVEGKPIEETLESSWKHFENLPLDRRKTLPHHVLPQLVKLQKAASLEERGQLWVRLSHIYEVWQELPPNNTPGATMTIPRAELQDTLSVLREWFEQKEVVQEVKHFAQARTLCCQIGEMLDPIQDIEVVQQLSEIMYDYGSTENLVVIAKSLVDKLKHVDHSSFDIDEGMGLTSDVYSKMISSLAQRRQDALAIQLCARLEECKISFDYEESGREVVLAILVQQIEQPDIVTSETEGSLELQRQVGKFGELSHFAHWRSMYGQMRSRLQQAIAEGQVKEEIDLVRVLGGDESKNALSLIKNRMRHLLVRPRYPLVAEPEVFEKIDALILEQGLDSMKLYEQYLARGFEADRELWRIAKMARLRIKTYSNFSKDLRAAAHMRAMEVRQRDALNHKKKWFPPAEITGRWRALEEIELEQEDGQQEVEQEVSSEEELPQAQQGHKNIYADASLGQILHLAVETGDTELAKATFQAVKVDPAIIWTLDDTLRALSLLEIFIADAQRTDLSRTAKQDAVQLACSFYVRWQQDLSVNPAAHSKARKIIPTRLRPPGLAIISLLARHQQIPGYVVGLQTLLQDPAFIPSKKHVQLLVKDTLRQGAFPWVALKLHLARGVFKRSPYDSRLREEFDHAFVNAGVEGIDFEHRTEIRWFERVLEFMESLDVELGFDALKRVLAVYEGKEEGKRGSIEEFVVSKMHKAEVKPATLKEELLFHLRLCNSMSFAADFMKLIDEGLILEAALKLEDVLKKLRSAGDDQDAKHALKLFVMSAEECGKDALPEVVQAIDNAETLLKTPSKKKSSKVEYRRRVASIQQSVQAEVAAIEKQVEIPVLPDESTVEPARSVQLADPAPGFLSDFFSDTEQVKPEEKPREEWQPSPYRESSPAAWQPSPQQAPQTWQEATVGFQDAVGPEVVQAAAATSTASYAEENTTGDFSQARQQAYAIMSKATPHQPVMSPASNPPSQAYSTLATQPDFFVAHSPNQTSSPSSPSLLQELSQLPQQFADLTMDQFLALKRRYEVEMKAVRKRDEELLAARRMALSRADASRWDGWQHVGATPWY